MKQQVVLYNKMYMIPMNPMTPGNDHKSDDIVVDSASFSVGTNWADLVSFSTDAETHFLYNLNVQIFPSESGSTGYTLCLYFGTVQVAITTGIDPAAVSTVVYVNYMYSSGKRQYCWSGFPVQILFLRQDGSTAPIADYATDSSFSFSITLGDLLEYSVYCLEYDENIEQFIPSFVSPDVMNLTLYSFIGAQPSVKYSDLPFSISSSANGYGSVNLGALVNLLQPTSNPFIPTIGELLYMICNADGSLLPFSSSQTPVSLASAYTYTYGVTSLTPLVQTLDDNTLTTFQMGSLSGFSSSDSVSTRKTGITSGAYYMHPSNNWAVPFTSFMVDTLVLQNRGPAPSTIFPSGTNLYEFAFSNWKNPVNGIPSFMYFYGAM